MTSDWVARGIAIAGASAGFGALGWNVYTFFRGGPKLKATATVTGRRDDMTISGRVKNTGRMEATIDAVRVSWEPARQGGVVRRYIFAPVPEDHLTGISQNTQIPAQQGREYTIVDIEGVDPGLNVALHDQRYYAFVWFVTATGSRAKARIKYKKS